MRRPAPGRLRRRPRAAAWLAALVALGGAGLLGCSGEFEVGTQGPAVFVGSAHWYEQVVDVCGICNGDNSTCQGCDGIPNTGRYVDACGKCLCFERPQRDWLPPQACLDRDAAFNKTCQDCSGVPNGPKEIDVCGECRDPAADPLFGQVCLGCDGIPNSGTMYDVCGICGGAGCKSSSGKLLPADKRSPCCDCAGDANGTHHIGLTCTCVDQYAPPTHERGLAPEELEYWQGYPENYTRGFGMLLEAQGLYAAVLPDINRLMELRDFYSSDPNPVNSYPTVPVRARLQAVKDTIEGAWALLKDPSADDNTTFWQEVYGWGNFTNPRDICGVCSGDNSTCLGCDPEAIASFGEALPFGGFMLDDCGVCHGNMTDLDECGICFGDNSTCSGCDGVPNSGKEFDACDGSDDPRMIAYYLGEEGAPELGDVGSGCSYPHEFKAACDAGGGGCCGCDGVPDSRKLFDGCGVCLHPSRDYKVWNDTCRGCDGVPNSGKVYDVCCKCDGESTVEDKCYQDMFAGSFDRDLFTHNKGLFLREYAAQAEYLVPKWLEKYDKCGECKGWKYEASTCMGCDLVPYSGAVYDACGVCGGTCDCEENPQCTAQGLAAATALVEIEAEEGYISYTPQRACHPYMTKGPGMNATHPAPCMLNRTLDTYRDKEGNLPNWAEGLNVCPGETYLPQNRPGIPDWLDTVETACHLWVEPPPPPAEEHLKQWLVLEYGVEYGPFSRKELEVGALTVIDPATSEPAEVAITNNTLIGRIERVDVVQSIAYGVTAMEKARAEYQKSKDLDVAEVREERIVGLTSEIDTANVIKVGGTQTVLDHGGRYLPLGEMPRLERALYPYCTGSTWRGADHRRHGLRTNLNYLGLIVTEGVADTEGEGDRAWNPDKEYIFDVATSWRDEQCTCRPEWSFGDGPVPPTCRRDWQTYEKWMDAGMYALSATRIEGSVDTVRPAPGGGTYVDVQGGTRYTGHYPNPDVEIADIYTRAVEQGTLTGNWISDGGVFKPDYGGGNFHETGAPAPTRGPWRVDGVGTFKKLTTIIDREDPDYNRCYKAVRLVNATKNAAGAMWYPQMQKVTNGWSVEVEFQISDASMECTDEARVVRSYAETVRTATHRTCRRKAGDGLAVVLADGARHPDTTVLLGDATGGLGYSGLRFALAVEIDTKYDPELDEPNYRHVAIHAGVNGQPTRAHFGNRVGFTADEIPDVTDGRRHVLRVTHELTNSVGLEAVLEAGALHGVSGSIQHFLSGRVGIVRVYVDDLEAPVLTVPLDMRAVLSARSQNAWVGVTASTGEDFATFDVHNLKFWR